MACNLNSYALLKQREILDILIGDTELMPGEQAGIRISMPYLKGSMICAISNNFGMPVEYGSGVQSRWGFMKDLLEHCEKNHRTSDLLSYLFSIDQFQEKLRGKSPSEIQILHKQITSLTIEKINGILYFGGNELVFSGQKYLVRQRGEKIEVASPTIDVIDRIYINELKKRAMTDIHLSNYDSALTKSRTILEEVLIYLIEKKGEHPASKGDIVKLHRQVKALYKMNQQKDYDKRINGLLSGMEKIITSISEMRNIASDSHGQGEKRFNIRESEAILFINSSTTIAEYYLSLAVQSKR